MTQVVDPNTLCLFCRRAVCLDRFYLFPCGHSIHAVCAHKLKWPLLGRSELEEECSSVVNLQGQKEKRSTAELSPVCVMHYLVLRVAILLLMLPDCSNGKIVKSK